MTAKHWTDDDAGYEKWLSAHASGFMANLRRRPSSTYFVIHRATHNLPDRSSPGSLNPRTGNQYSKVTATTIGELVEWARLKLPALRLGGQNFCKTCTPTGESPIESVLYDPAAGHEQDWSAGEVAAVVADYFAMLKDELVGKAYSKTAHRQALLQLLAKRNGRAVEFNHCNISAVLQGMGLTYVAGYKPRRNYQALLAGQVRKFLTARPELRKQIVEEDAAPVDSPPDGSRFKLHDIEIPPPPPPPPPADGRGTVKPVKVDWSEVNAYSRKLGEQGEKFVLDLDKRRLRDVGRLDLESKVEWASMPQGAGYDLRSFEATGDELFIENYLRFRLSPSSAIALAARVKLAGKEFVGDQRELYLFEEQSGEEAPYERLLGDAMAGDGALFTREDAVEAAWAVVERVLKTHHRTRPYKRGSWGPKEADELIAPDGCWRNPSPKEASGVSRGAQYPG